MPLHRRLPKRGFTNAPFRKDYSTISVGDLARLTDVADGARIGPEEMLKAGLVRNLKGQTMTIPAKPSFHVVAVHFTKGAEEKIAQAGGKCEVIS